MPEPEATTPARRGSRGSAGAALARRASNDTAASPAGRVLAGLLFALAMAGFPGCGGEREFRPNLLLVTVDTLRPDRLSSYGYPHHRTPNIDRLAAEGALFECAVTDSPWTTPAMASVMTGNYPTLHGFKSTNVDRLGLDNVTLAEILSGAGWATAAVIGSFPLDSIYQLDQGFDLYDDAFTTPIWIRPDHVFEHQPSVFLESPEAQRFFILSKTLNDSRRTDPEVTDVALAWLGDERSEPFFLWVHYFGPHEQPDWTVPEPQRQLRHVQMYDPAVRANDREIGRLLAALDEAGLTSRTLVVFHADHGESLGEQGLLGHGMLLNQASIRVPLIMRFPGVIAAGVRVERLVRNVDVFSTILDVAGVTIDHEVSGESVLPLVSASPWRRLPALLRRVGDEPVAYLESYFPAHSAVARPVELPDGTELLVGSILRGVQTAEWKYIRTDPHPLLDVSRGSVPDLPESVADSVQRETLFDLRFPNGESRDVLAAHPQQAARLRALLERHIAAERNPDPAPKMSVDEEVRLRLESLGYGD